jgi:Ti-type conjugative transfer relaxase TraA
MNPRINVGKGVTGAVNYVLGEGRDPKTGELLPDPLDGSSRVAWIGGTGFGFNIETEAHAEVARRIMEYDARWQKGQAQQDCMHLSLSWRPGEQPTREQMEEAAHDALKALGMANAKALFVAHDDEDYAHVHIVASNINPATGYRYDLAASQRKLSAWALDFEREHGGVISTRRETANELRDAITERDAGGVLEALTKQRSTFTGKILENALAKEIKGELARAQFADKILDHADIVHLSDRPGGPTTRYTTRAVLEAEQYVMRAAEGLVARSGFQIDDKQRGQIIGSEKFDAITREQARAFRHATGAEGLAIIDGQAGTGKSYTLAAIREAYEASGAKVIGLAPTNAVAQDMKGDGFGHSATLHSELFALNNGRRTWDSQTVVIVDEAAMLDTKLMAMLTAHANDSGAKLILVGDDRQLSSIDRGGMFGVLKDRFGAAELSEVKRQHKLDERRAAEMMAEGNYHDALNIYQDKGAVHWTRTQGQARAELVEQWAKDSAARPDKTRFVFAYTNDDVSQLNAALRQVRKERGELLGQDHEIDTATGRQKFAAGDRIQFTGTDKPAGIVNGAAGTIEAIDGTHIAVKLDGKHPKTINFDAASFDQFRHGYAGTIYRGQGRTLDQTYLYHSEHWRSAASYVALTRHRDKAELFVARNTAADVNQLARQMARTDDRRAASMFHHRQEIGPVRPMTAREVLERFAGDSFRQPPDENRRRGPEGGAHVRDYGPKPKPPWPSAREQRRPYQHKEQVAMGPGDMGIDDERRKRRSAPIVDLMTPDAIQETADQPPRPQQPDDTREEMTLEGILQNPWKAVDLDLPQDGDRAFLRTAARAADTCAQTAFAYGRVAAVVEPERAEFYRERYETAAERRTEAQQQLERLPPEQTADVSAFFHPELAQQQAEAVLLAQDATAALARDPSRHTDYFARSEEIRENPWNALKYPPAPNASPDFLNLLAETYVSLHHIAREQREVSYTPAEREIWEGYARLAHSSLGYACGLLRENYGREFQAAAATATERDLAAEARPVTQDNEPQPAMTREAIERDPWNAVALDLPADADHELLFLAATTARDLQSSLSERGSEATTPDQRQLWLDLAERAKERQTEAEAQIVAVDAAPRPEQDKAQPLTLDEIAERVQRILDDPTRQADELDESVLQALQNRRAADIDAAQTAATAAEDELTSSASGGDDEPQDRSSSADPAAEAIEEAASSREQTEDEQVQYSRWTGRPISGAGRETTGRSQGGGRGGGRGQSR